MRTGAMRWLAMAVAASAACGGDGRGGNPPAAADSATDSGTVAASPVDSAATMAAETATVAVMPTSLIGFSHARHRGLDCHRCHGEVAGHASHAGVACKDCHAPPPAPAKEVGPADCGSCHHAGAQGRACTACHQPGQRGATSLTVSLKLSVWSAPRTRELEFDHRRHADLQCRTCHTDAPAFAARPDCGTCHAHHAGGADCRVCHPSPPAGAHTAAAHSGCAGAGCHSDPPVRSATVSRPECLLCHPDRVDHEPGKVCARCHMPESASEGARR